MVTDDERRKVAAGLRRLAEKHDGVAWLLIAKRLGLVDDEAFLTGSVYTSRSVSRLADLIEPAPERTCHFVYDENENEYKCDVCGCFVTQSELWKAEYHVTRLTSEYFVYCPFCGAMVVSGDGY